jgi:transposase-like protein
MTLSIASPNTTSLKAPKRPRRSCTPAEQAAHLAAFTAGGLSATAFYRRLGIRRATLARWRQRASAAGPARGRRATHPRAEAPSFAAVTVMPDLWRGIVGAAFAGAPPHRVAEASARRSREARPRCR